MIEVRELTKNYDGKQILSTAEFQARAGEITAIVGPSAAGKSTLMRLLAGLELGENGVIAFRGKMASPAQLRQVSSLVLQQPVALRGSVLFNAMLAPRLMGASRQDARTLALTALKQVGLNEITKQDARKLSGGELVRLALARALAKNPELLLLDEATANLDPSNILRIERAIAQAAASGKAVVMVTHNLPQARRLSQSTAVVMGGKLICQDTTETIFNHHPDTTVRAFVAGEMIF